MVLGASADEAATVVDLLADKDLLTHGVAVVAAAAAVRWGVELTEAVKGLAGGRALHGRFSDYELRFGREEAESDLETAWQAVTSLDDTAWAELQRCVVDITQGDVAAGREALPPSVESSDFHLDVAALAGFR